MSWGRIDDGAPTHPKFIQAGPLAFGFFWAGCCYANRHRTDGFIPTKAIFSILPGMRRGACVSTAVALVEAGLWEVKNDGYQIHDFLKYNPSRAQHEEETAKAAERKARWRERHGNGVRNAEGTAVERVPHTQTHTQPKPKEARSKGNGVLSDADFLAALKANPAYVGIDIDRELGKLDAWLMTPKGRGKTKSRQRIVNWLNGADRAVAAPAIDRHHVNDAWKDKTEARDVKL